MRAGKWTLQSLRSRRPARSRLLEKSPVTRGLWSSARRNLISSFVTWDVRQLKSRLSNTSPCALNSCGTRPRPRRGRHRSGDRRLVEPGRGRIYRHDGRLQCRLPDPCDGGDGRTAAHRHRHARDDAVIKRRPILTVQRPPVLRFVPGMGRAFAGDDAVDAKRIARRLVEAAA